MRYGQLKESIENGEYDNYTDTVDVSIEISLFEYGIIRDPITTECLFCNPVDDWNMEDDDNSIHLIRNDVSIQDVKDYLIEDASKGFFTYIGSDLETELERLDNSYLAHIIQSINQYDGWFRD